MLFRSREAKELDENHEYEHRELTNIYIKRGLDELLAEQVATQLMAHDALGAHARDELGLSELHTARPLQAALASAVTFAIGAALPLLLAAVAPMENFDLPVAGGSLVMLAMRLMLWSNLASMSTSSDNEAAMWSTGGWNQSGRHTSSRPR